MNKKYLKFEPETSTGKTERWLVQSVHEDYLGRIHWYNPWRRYVFAPFENTIFDATCLTIISDFCAAVTKEHKEKVSI